MPTPSQVHRGERRDEDQYSFVSVQRLPQPAAAAGPGWTVHRCGAAGRGVAGDPRRHREAAGPQEHRRGSGLRPGRARPRPVRRGAVRAAVDVRRDRPDQQHRTAHQGRCHQPAEDRRGVRGRAHRGQGPRRRGRALGRDDQGGPAQGHHPVDVGVRVPDRRGQQGRHRRRRQRRGPHLVQEALRPETHRPRRQPRRRPRPHVPGQDRLLRRRHRRQGAGHEVLARQGPGHEDGADRPAGQERRRQAAAPRLGPGHRRRERRRRGGRGELRQDASPPTRPTASTGSRRRACRRPPTRAWPTPR